MSGKRKLHAGIIVGALFLSARLPLAAQVSSSQAAHPTSRSAGAPTSQSPAVTISSPSPIGDTTALAKEAQGWLIDMIRTNTTNPPGNEQAVAKYLAHILEKEGIQSEMLDLAPGRSALVARLKSSAMADPSKALLLVAHMDVVGVDRSKWTVRPFAAVIRDGYLYGRGSLDDKGMLAANLAAFIALKRSNARLIETLFFWPPPTKSRAATPASEC